MLEVACRSPKLNAELITAEGLQVLGHTTANPILNSFGVKVNPIMEIVSARILPSPPVKYKKSTARIAPGTAQWNLRDVQFAAGGTLKNWVVMVMKEGAGNFPGGIGEVKDVVRKFSQMLKTSGVQVVNDMPRQLHLCIPQGKPDQMRKDAEVALRKTLNEICSAGKPNFMLVLLANDNQRVYSHIRTLVDCVYGISTICCQSEKIKKEKGQPQYLGNIALKANLKLGGRNHELGGTALQFLGNDTIILGADVTHPTAKVSVEYTPSIAGVVGSFDISYSVYPGSLRLQTSRQEVASPPLIPLNKLTPPDD